MRCSVGMIVPQTATSTSRWWRSIDSSMRSNPD